MRRHVRDRLAEPERGEFVKQIKASGITAITALVLAIGGGAAGAAMVMGNDGGPAPRPSEVGLKVADEATATPSAAPSPEPTMEPTTMPEPSSPSTSTVTDPAPAEETPVPPTDAETAQQAADRAEKAAKRAEDAADKAAAATPAPTPVPATPTPTPKAIVIDHSYDCPAGSKYAALGATQTRVKNPTIDDCGGPA